jgi:hypothetical protein
MIGPEMEISMGGIDPRHANGRAADARVQPDDALPP